MRAACRSRVSLRNFSRSCRQVVHGVFGYARCSISLRAAGNVTRVGRSSFLNRFDDCVAYQGGRVPRGSRDRQMQPSMFNVQVPLAEQGEVFLMNTMSDAQLLVSPDVTGLLERISRGDSGFNDEERSTIEALAENGFIVNDRDEERASLRQYFTNMREDTDQLRITVLT